MRKSRLQSVVAALAVFAGARYASHAIAAPDLVLQPVDTLLSVDLSERSQQQGVLSVKAGATAAPTHLALLLPGDPSVVRPVVENGRMVRSRLGGNFLIRARRHLVDDAIATLIVDCATDLGDYCSPDYQSSPQRLADVERLIELARQQLPSLQQVWLVGTSLGTVSSTYMAKHGGAKFAGALHTASITQFYQGISLISFDYASITIPQAFVHHVDDSCRVTPFSGAEQMATRSGVRLVAVRGGGDYSGHPCEAFAAHGFRGIEQPVMRMIARIITKGVGAATDVPPDAVTSSDTSTSR